MMAEAIPVILEVVKVVAAIATAISSWTKETNDIKAAPAYDEKTATIDETVAMNKLLSTKRKDFQGICTDLEKQLDSVTQIVFDRLVKGIADSKNETGVSVSIDYVKREFENYKSELKDGISGMVTRRLALSDSECAKILKEEAGEPRSAKIDNFVKKIIQEGFVKYQNGFVKIIDQAFVMVKDKVSEKNADKEKELAIALKEIESLNRNLSSAEITEKKKEYTHKIASIDAFLAI
jgi:hypothetical protein